MNYEKLRMSQELQDYIWGNMREKIHAKFKEKESALYKEFRSEERRVGKECAI